MAAMVTQTNHNVTFLRMLSIFLRSLRWRRW